MKKPAIVTAITILLLFMIFPIVALANFGFSVGPAAINITVPADGKSTALIYISSDFEGELIVGSEDIPFQVNPKIIPVSSSDNNSEVELTLYGNDAVEEGLYSGKLTFLAQTHSNVAYGVKINASITQVGQQEQADNLNSKESKDTFMNMLADNATVIVLAGLVLIALIVGIMIGRKKSSEA